ncbi:hypothetical protein D3C84_958710 [compost metagenome]
MRMPRSLLAFTGLTLWSEGRAPDSTAFRNSSKSNLLSAPSISGTSRLLCLFLIDLSGPSSLISMHQRPSTCLMSFLVK